jgi:exonuclease III
MPGLRFLRGRWWCTKSSSRSPTSVPEISMFSMNVNGINRSSKRDVLSAMCKEHDWGFLLMSDTRIHDEKEIPTVSRAFGCKDSVWSLGSPHSGGTTILLFKTVLVTARFNDPGGIFSRIDYVWEGESFSLLCIYAPADPIGRKKFFSDTFSKHLKSNPVNDRCFLGGDFNFVENPLMDRVSSNLQGGCIGLDQWYDCTKNLQLKDLFRVFNPKAKSFTFRSSAHKMQIRIDRVYSSADGISFVNKCRHIPVPSVVSDHISGVEVLLRSINNVSRGPSFWKLNTSLMKRPGFAKIVEKLIIDFQSSRDKYPDLCTWWEMLKLAI